MRLPHLLLGQPGLSPVSVCIKEVLPGAQELLTCGRANWRTGFTGIRCLLGWGPGATPLLTLVLRRGGQGPERA